MPLTDQLSAALLASKSDAIIVADAKGVIQLWNPGRNASSVTPPLKQWDNPSIS
jgi:hypothetical protein